MAEQTNTVVGIDVGTTKICTLVGELNAEGAMQIVGVGVTPARGIRKGAVINVTEAGEAPLRPRSRKPRARAAIRSGARL